MLFDRVEDAKGAQTGMVAGKGRDEATAQLPPARDEENECGEKQQEFGEGRWQEFDGGLHPFKLRHLERCCRKRIGGADHALKLVPDCERAIENIQLVLQ